MLGPEDIKRQSKNAYKQWATQWREQAKENGKWPMKSMVQFENIGIGKAVLCVANGYSVEVEIETIKAQQDKVDILCCDKSLGHLLRNGIKPTYCLVADANVNYEKYLKPYEAQLSDTILFLNVCANPKWADNGNWKDRFFFCNADVLGSEKEFGALSGCPNVVPAGTNVSNALVVMLTQSDNTGRRNFFGYDKILLIGFDYCWAPDGKYYAFDENAEGKANYMRHAYTLDHRGKICYSSQNLIFSAQWLATYVTSFKLPVIQCTDRTVFGLGRKRGILSEQMNYSFRPDDRDRAKRVIELRRKLSEQIKDFDTQILEMSRDHYYSYLRSLS